MLKMSIYAECYARIMDILLSLITGCKWMVNDNMACLLNRKGIIDYTSETTTTIQSIKLNQYDVYIKLIVCELP